MTETIFDDDRNPYVTSASNGPPVQTHPKKILWRPLISGALWSVFSSFPIAAVLALLYRFPVPFLGYVSGIEAIIPAMVGTLVYGVLLGGFFLLGSFGALIAFSVNRFDAGSVKHRTWSAIILCVAATFLCLLLLATLDKFIGPW